MMRTSAQRDLFGRTEYPDSPGAKEKHGTSQMAADAIAPRAETLRGRALATLVAFWPNGLSADQVASMCGVSVLAMRPRVSELYKMGLIEKTLNTAPNASGHSARMWRYINRGSAAS